MASPGKRIGSFLIDIALLTLLNFPLAILISNLPVNIKKSLPQNFIVVFLFVWFCYFLFMDIFSQGQTIGKKILGIKVVQEEGLKPPEPGNAIIRNLIKTISGPLLIVFLFTNHHKALHDMAAGTVVAEK